MNKLRVLLVRSVSIQKFYSIIMKKDEFGPAADGGKFVEEQELFKSKCVDTPRLSDSDSCFLFAQRCQSQVAPAWRFGGFCLRSCPLLSLSLSLSL